MVVHMFENAFCIPCFEMHTGRGGAGRGGAGLSRSILCRIRRFACGSPRYFATNFESRRPPAFVVPSLATHPLLGRCECWTIEHSAGGTCWLKTSAAGRRPYADHVSGWPGPPGPEPPSPPPPPPHAFGRPPELVNSLFVNGGRMVRARCVYVVGTAYSVTNTALPPPPIPPPAAVCCVLR